MADTVKLDRPWWVMEGYVVAPVTYIIVGEDGDTETQIVLTTHGEARLLEPAPGIEPTAASATL